ncbi:hypothetical protein [Endozoicomonas sp. ISHI1]|uniref:hypothetical protein n=2 Tax=unclassified Endozoicomonas TaxID=2644528 RepID=UPI00214797BF|nr:hypothetical protein [Endozoicomonas sp. ISHI1]
MVRSMSLEYRVEKLESHFESLDNAVHRLIEITGETQKIVLENQRENRLMFERQDRKIEAYQSENRKRFDQHDKRFDQHDKRFDQHDKRFDQHDKRFDKIEETLAIIVNHLQK